MTRPRNPLRVERLEDRLTPAFGLDPTFGGTGRVTTWGVHSVYTPDVAVQADGGILTTAAPLVDRTSAPFSGGFGPLSQTRGELIRFTPDGKQDVTFGAGERAFFEQSAFGGTRVAVGADGRIYVAATTGDTPGFVVADGAYNVTVYRFHADGTRDTTFGAVTLDFGGVPGASNSSLNELALQADGKVVVVGNVGAPYGPPVEIPAGFSVARLNADGTLDPTFDGDGFLRYTFGPGVEVGRANGVAVAADGKILVAGTTAGPILVSGHPESRTDYATVVRLNPDGSPDGSFGGDGEWTGAAGTVGVDVFPLPGGKVLVTGGVDQSVSVFRLDASGAIDASFGTGGWVAVTPVGTTAIVDAALLPDGRIAIVSSFSNSYANYQVTVAVLSADGVRLPAFVGGESFGVAFDDTTATPRNGAVAVAPDGRIVIAAGLYRETGTSLGLAVLADAEAVPMPPPILTPPVVTNLADGGRVVTADVDGDGTPDTVTVTGPGTPIRVTVVSGKDGSTVAAFDPFGGDFTGGGYVAAGDFDGDGRSEFVVTPDEGGGPRVSMFSLVNGTPVTRANFLGIDDADFRGGARAAIGDINGDGVPDVVVAAGFGGGPRTAIFSGKSVFGTPARLVNDFFAFPGTDAVTLRNGSFVAVGDVDGDGFADLIFGGGPGGAPRVFILSGARVSANDVAGAQASPVANFFVAGDANDRGGIRLAAKDVDGDSKADVVAGSGEGRPSPVRVYLGKDFTTGGEPVAFQDLDPFGATLPGGVFVG